MNDVSMTVGMEAQSHGDSIMAVCDDSRIPRPGSPADDEHGVIIFTDSDCETIMDELDTPRTEKQKKFIKSHSSNVIGSYKKEKDVILKSDQVLEFSASIVKNGNHDTNSRKSAFSRVKHSKGKNQTILEDAVTVQSNHDHQPIQKHLDSAPTGNTSGGVPKVSSNGKGDGVSRHHGNRELVDPRNEQDDGLDDRGVKENDRTNSITKVTLNISNLESPEEGEDLEARPSRSSTNSSSSSLRDQGSQTCSEAAGDILQYPVSPRVSPATVARYSPRRITSAELHRTPDQMVKQADRLIERTQAILERSAEAKRRTEVLLKASRERRAQERLEELASYKGERLGNSKDANGSNDHRTGASLDTNGNHEDNGYEEENSNVIPTH